jgi:hypothetical protein
MVIQYFWPAFGLARSVIRSRLCGLWRAVLTYLEGRSAVIFERERRTTLLAVSPMLSPGTEIYDSRADGSVLSVRVAVAPPSLPRAERAEE